MGEAILYCYCKGCWELNYFRVSENPTVGAALSCTNYTELVW